LAGLEFSISRSQILSQSIPQRLPNGFAIPIVGDGQTQCCQRRRCRVKDADGSLQSQFTAPACQSASGEPGDGRFVRRIATVIFVNAAVIGGAPLALGRAGRKIAGILTARCHFGEKRLGIPPPFRSPSAQRG
jgi:hypothetical protein